MPVELSARATSDLFQNHPFACKQPQVECRNTAHWMAQRTARKLPELDEQQPLRIVDFDKFNDDNRDGGVWMLAHEIRLKIGRQGKRIRTQNFVSVRCATTYMEPDEFSRVPLGSAKKPGSQWHPEKMRGCHVSEGNTSIYKNQDAMSFNLAFHFPIAEINALGWF